MDMTCSPPLSPDESLRAAILDLFAADARTTSADLRVGVLNGVAHLAGIVTSLEVRDAAEERAKSVSGVRGVVNRIEAPGAPSPARTVNLILHNEEQPMNKQNEHPAGNLDSYRDPAIHSATNRT